MNNNKQCKQCDGDKVCNPESGRCVLKDGRILKVKRKDCDPMTEVEHPTTGRCIRRCALETAAEFVCLG